jgi:hypothetical protein
MQASLGSLILLIKEKKPIHYIFLDYVLFANQYWVEMKKSIS